MLKTWIQALRLPFTSITVVTVLFGTVLAYARTGRGTDLPLLLLTGLSTLFFHLGSNVINDYFDDINGTDLANKEFIAPFTGGARLIQQGQISRGQTLILALILYGIAIALGILLISLKGYGVLLFGLIGLILGILYSAFLVRWFLGELSVGIAFGILMVSGSYWIQTGTLPAELFLYALPPTFLTMMIIWINQFPDYAADNKSGKKNLVVRLGRKRAAGGYPFLSAAAYGCLTVAAIIENSYLFIPLALLPAAVAAALLLNRYHDSIGEAAFLLPLTITLHHGTLLAAIGAMLLLRENLIPGTALIAIGILPVYGLLLKGVRTIGQR